MARAIAPWAWDIPERLLKTRFVVQDRRANGGEIYVWDYEHSSICSPDGSEHRVYPWRKLETVEDAQTAADALNAEPLAPYKRRQADALAAAQACWEASPGPDAIKSLEIVRQSLTEQAMARADPTMPRLIPAVIEALRADSEAGYALAETREDRVKAHGLSLLCDWQDAARKALRQALPQGEQT